MSLGTLLGFISGFGLFIGSILMSTDLAGASVFINFPSILMVIGGTVAATFISFEPKFCMQAFKLSATIIFTHKDSNAILKNEVGRIIRWGYIVQKNGLQGLESDAESAAASDRFLGFGVDLVITGYTGEEVRDILSATVDTTFERGKQQVDILKAMGGNSPAFGMIGTLIGLIIMLGNMGGDPNAIGPGMAVALITTLYGVMAARLVFIPAAEKLSQRDKISQFRNFLIAEGLALLAERKSPRYIQDKMNAYLDPSQHFNIDTDMAEKP